MQNRHRRLLRASLSSLFAAALLGPWQPALAQFTQQTQALDGNFVDGPNFEQGGYVAISGDGNTALWSGRADSASAGSSWVFVRGGPKGWSQQGVAPLTKGQFDVASGPVALSGDGNTALVESGTGIVVFTRSGGTWTRQAALTAPGPFNPNLRFGGLAISGDASTVIVAASLDTSGAGGAFIFTNNAGVWSQQGGHLVVSGAIGAPGFSAVALSADGNMALISGSADNGGVGATWVFTRSGGAWTQQAKLVGSNAIGNAGQGSGVALSSDGNTAFVCGPGDNNDAGAAWAFTRGGDGQWTQQGDKMVGSTGANANAKGVLGAAVALSGDGNTALVGSLGDGYSGAVRAFARSAGAWFQLGNRMVPGDATPRDPTLFNSDLVGSSVALSADGQTAIIGGPGQGLNDGAVWIYAATGFQPPAVSTHDFNDDHVSDIVWRRSDGAIAKWLMQSENPPSQPSPISSVQNVGTVPTNWQIVGQRDFNNDGICDLLWRDASTGTVAIWLMDTFKILQIGSLGAVPANWSIVGTADFNHDGKGDILWRDSNTGTVAIWLLDGLSIQQAGSLGAVPANWTISAVDRLGNVFWRDSNTGALAVWQVFGLGVAASANLGVVPSNWVIAGTGDFDGNGSSDILWRDANTGTVAIWLMNGAQLIQSVGVANVPTDWSIIETGDFNGDGKSDILWRDSSGTVAIWFMNGAQITQSVGVTNVPTVWSIQAANAD